MVSDFVESKASHKNGAKTRWFEVDTPNGSILQLKGKNAQVAI